MPHPIAPQPPRTSRAAYGYAMIPVVLLATTLIGWGTMITIAVDDPGFAVEKDFYKKAVSWDATQAQMGRNARLGWRLKVAPLTIGQGGKARVEVTALDAHGKPLEGLKLRGVTFHNGRAARQLELRLEEAAPGTYVTEAPLRRPGVWELRLVAERAAVRFTAIVRQDATLGPAPGAR